jgi:hypothetical protein
MFLRKTRNITLTILGSIAAAACGDDIKHCVDENGVVQDEENCEGPDDAGVMHQSRSGFHWYYGGYSSPQPRGTKVGGGSFTPSPGHAYSPPSIGRGGFGQTGHGFNGGGS